jgi:hypothetical protein
MTQDLGEFAYQLLRVINPGQVHYLSVPITSGLAEIELLRRYGCSREELRRDHAEEFRHEVIVPNERHAENYAKVLRERNPGICVINPGGLFVPGWGQDEYMAFWIGMIRQQVATLVFPPETIYSTGGRMELCLALQTQVPVVDLYLQPLSPAQLQHHLAAARNQLRQRWDQDQINAYLPYVDFQSLVPFAAPVDAGAAEQFGKFAADHNLRSQEHRRDIEGE